MSCFLCHVFCVMLFVSWFLYHAFCVMFFVSCFFVMLFVSFCLSLSHLSLQVCLYLPPLTTNLWTFSSLFFRNVALSFYAFSVSLFPFASFLICIVIALSPFASFLYLYLWSCYLLYLQYHRNVEKKQRKRAKHWIVSIINAPAVQSSHLNIYLIIDHKYYQIIDKPLNLIKPVVT